MADIEPDPERIAQTYHPWFQNRQAEERWVRDMLDLVDAASAPLWQVAAVTWKLALEAPEKGDQLAFEKYKAIIEAVDRQLEPAMAIRHDVLSGYFRQEPRD